jgi:SNF2 family DNA or RNA helicase
VLLLSIKAGGCGLNLQMAASVVVLLEPWWNGSTESQAIGRVLRMGQPRTVYVRRLRCARTVEERIFEIQERKAHLASSALSEDTLKKEGGARNALTVEELRSFFADSE